MPELCGVARTLAVLCFLTAPLAARELDSACNGMNGVFTLFASDPGHPNQTTSSAPSAKKQAFSRVSGIPHVPMSGHEKWNYYLKSTYGPRSIAYSVLGAGIKQAQGSVPEWGGGMAGYGKRFGSAYAQKAINRSIRAALNGLLHEDPRYFPSSRSGSWKRSLYAVAQTFVTHKDEGGTRIAFSRFAGHFGAAYISRQWYPNSYHTAGDYLGSGFKSVGIDAAKNIFSEFWPDIKRLIRH